MNSKAADNLSNAIILSAVDDYRKALAGKRVAGKRVAGKEPGWVISDCERFFLSEWFSILTNLDGKTLLDKLKNE